MEEGRRHLPARPLTHEEDGSAAAGEAHRIGDQQVRLGGGEGAEVLFAGEQHHHLGRLGGDVDPEVGLVGRLGLARGLVEEAQQLACRLVRVEAEPAEPAGWLAAGHRLGSGGVPPAGPALVLHGEPASAPLEDRQIGQLVEGGRRAVGCWARRAW